MDWSHVLRFRSLLNRSGRWDMIGRGPLIKTDFPQRFKKEKRSLKSRFVSSVCRRAISLWPVWSITRCMEDGRELISSGSLSRMDVTLAPGKQRVVALKKRIFLVMLSPTIKVVGETRGCGECRGSRVSTRLGVGSTLRDRADEWGGEPAASGPGGWVTARAEVGCLPERLSTASFTILRREGRSPYAVQSVELDPHLCDRSPLHCLPPVAVE